MISDTVFRLTSRSVLYSASSFSKRPYLLLKGTTLVLSETPLSCLKPSIHFNVIRFYSHTPPYSWIPVSDHSPRRVSVLAPPLDLASGPPVSFSSSYRPDSDVPLLTRVKVPETLHDLHRRHCTSLHVNPSKKSVTEPVLNLQHQRPRPPSDSVIEPTLSSRIQSPRLLLPFIPFPDSVLHLSFGSLGVLVSTILQSIELQ